MAKDGVSPYFTYLMVLMCFFSGHWGLIVVIHVSVRAESRRPGFGPRTGCQPPKMAARQLGQDRYMFELPGIRVFIILLSSLFGFIRCSLVADKSAWGCGLAVPEQADEQLLGEISD